MNTTVDVIIGTANRPNSLIETIRHILEQDIEHLELRILIADNSSSPASSEAVEESFGGLVEVLRSKQPGRSKAVNEALDLSSGDIVVFTDDDTTPQHTWLRELIAMLGVQHKHTSVLACGPIEPQFPTPCPAWLKGTVLEGVAYAHFSPNISRGPLPISIMPLGPNFAVRRSSIRGLRFREDLGPSVTNGPISCDDIAFVGELRTRFLPLIPGGGFMYSSHARVLHRIRAEQMSDAWIYDRFFHYGRSVVAMKGKLSYFHSPSRLLNPEAVAGAELLSAELSYYLGQVHQLKRLGIEESAAFITDWLVDTRTLSRRLPLGPLGRLEADRLLLPNMI